MPERAQPSGQRTRTEPQIFHHAFPATALAVRDALRAALARFMRLMSEDEAGTLELILAEVLNNIVEHSYAETGRGTITLTMARDGRGLTCAVSDDGVPLPESCIASARRDGARPEPDSLPEGGFGWFLIHDLAEDLGYRRQDGRNMLAFRLPLAPLETRQAG